MDVTSLYTNILHALALLYVRAFLENFRENAGAPSNESLVNLLELILKLNNFQFDDENYLQVGGTAMGTKVAPSLANIFMDYFEHEFVHSHPQKCLFYKRFLDDIFIIWPHGRDELDKWIEHLSGCLPNIKFMGEISDTSVAFLDTLVHLEPDDLIWTDLYSKPTDSHNYLEYSSAHPADCKKS